MVREKGTGIPPDVDRHGGKGMGGIWVKPAAGHVDPLPPAVLVEEPSRRVTAEIAQVAGFHAQPGERRHSLRHRTAGMLGELQNPPGGIFFRIVLAETDFIHAQMSNGYHIRRLVWNHIDHLSLRPKTDFCILITIPYRISVCNTLAGNFKGKEEHIRIDRRCSGGLCSLQTARIRPVSPRSEKGFRRQIGTLDMVHNHFNEF